MSDIRFSKGGSLKRKEFGGDGAEGTPGSIPNPEVKLRRGEGRGGTPENSALPSSFLFWAPIGGLFAFFSVYPIRMKWLLKKIDKETNHRFLNFYTLHYDVDGKPYSYFLASRNEEISSLRCTQRSISRPDAVLIGAYQIQENGSVSFLLEKQFRPALNRDVYSFPAGLMDPGDKDEAETSARELGEETGFVLESVEVLLPPSPTSEGLSDECNSVVLAKLSHGKKEAHKEEFEDISCRLYSSEEVRKLLNDPSILFSNSARLLILYLLERFKA